jgi:hypothetical protein
MSIILIFAIALVGLLWIFSTRVMDAAVQALSDPGEKIRMRTHVPSEPHIRRFMQALETWTRDHGYEDDLMFDFGLINAEQGLFCHTWKHQGEHVYLVFYAGLGKAFLELTTIYDDKTSVTTTNAAEAHTLPVVPGSFVQTFPGRNLTTLRKLHLEGCRTLERRTGLMPRENSDDNTAELIVKALTRQSGYIKSIPGWRWKGIWWLIRRKHQMAEKDVGQQLDWFGVYEPDVPPTDLVQ